MRPIMEPPVIDEQIIRFERCVGVLDALRVENVDMVYEFKGMRTMAVRAITPRVYMHQIWHLFVQIEDDGVAS